MRDTACCSLEKQWAEKARVRVFLHRSVPFTLPYIVLISGPSGRLATSRSRLVRHALGVRLLPPYEPTLVQVTREMLRRAALPAPSCD